MAATPATSLTLVSSGLADARQQPPRGNPDINQFLKVLHKTTRWSAQWNRIDFDGSPEFGQRVSLTVPPLAELVSGLNIVVTMPDIYTTQLNAKQAAGENFLGPTYGWTNSLGHALIQQIDLEIGGAIVESLTGQQLEILDELYETVESAITKNAMIKRTPNGFGPTTWLTSSPTQVYIPIPFWFSRPGIYSHALPIDALRSDKVRIHVTFRPIEQLYYTDARVSVETVGYRPGQDVEGGMWGITGGRFWQADSSQTTMVYSMNATMGSSGTQGKIIPGVQFPLRFSPIDAYALIEYISLEEYEAVVFRSSELTYQVEQHLAIPVQASLGQSEIRMVIPFTNPTKEIHWVLQRPEAEIYNAWFLFTRDLSAPALPQNGPINPCLVPWWPDAQLIPKQTNQWQIVPAFQNAYSEPLASATLLYNSFERFVHEGGSFFRGIVPAISYVKSAVHDRYIYAYHFGQKEERLKYGPSGAANWDKIPRKEIFITLNRGRNNTSPPNMNIYVYTTIWNVFKIFGGRGGMLFSN
jgi:hypothetical protein